MIWIDRCMSAATKLLMWIGCLAVVLMALHVTGDVLRRSLFNQGFLGTTEIVSFYYMVAVVCLPLAWVERRDEHINVEILFLKLPPAGKRVLLAFSSLCSGAFFAVFTYRSWLDALSAYSTGETMMGYAEIVIWPARFILPVSFALVVVVCVGQLARAFRPGSDAGADRPPEEDATFRA